MEHAGSIFGIKACGALFGIGAVKGRRSEWK
jgi:hypothetical protein